MSCDSKNLIYCIICGGCEEFYIGETGSILRTRIRIHKQHINQPEYRKIKLSEHLDKCGNGHFSVIPIYKLYTNSVLGRREKEKHFIRLLRFIVTLLRGTTLLYILCFSKHYSAKRFEMISIVLKED